MLTSTQLKLKLEEKENKKAKKIWKLPKMVFKEQSRKVLIDAPEIKLELSYVHWVEQKERNLSLKLLRLYTSKILIGICYPVYFMLLK